MKVDIFITVSKLLQSWCTMFLVTFEQIRTVTVAKRGKLDASSIRGDAYYATFFFFFNSFFFFFFWPGETRILSPSKHLKRSKIASILVVGPLKL